MTGERHEGALSVADLPTLVSGAVLVVDEDGRLLRAGEHATELFGLDSGRVGRTSTPDFYDLDGQQLSSGMHPAERAMDTGAPIEDVECLVDGAEGRRRVRVDAAPLAGGGPGGSDGAVLTVDPIEAIEDEQDGENDPQHEPGLDPAPPPEPEAVLERSSDAFAAVDDDLRFTYVNEAAERLLETPEAELLGTSMWEAFPEARDTKIRDRIEAVRRTGEARRVELYYEPLEFRIEARFYPAEDGLRAYFRDVTQRESRKRELEQYETIVETIDDGVYVMDEAGRFVMVNDAYTELTGYEEAELLGEPGTKVVSEETAQRAAELHDELSADADSPARIEATLETASGEEIEAEATFSIIETDEGPNMRIGVVRDVTERKARERELATRSQQQAAIADLGEYAVQPEALDAFLDRAARVVADVLGNEYCKVLDLDPDAEELHLRNGVGWDPGHVGEATVSATENCSQAAYTLGQQEPVVVEDLAADDRIDGPELLTDHDVVSGISVVIGSVDDPWGILGTHDTERRSFAEHDVEFVQSVATLIASVIENHQRRRRIEASRERYRTLVDNFPNGAVALIDTDMEYSLVGGTILSDISMTADDLEGEPVGDVLPDSFADQVVPEYRATLEGERRSFLTENDGVVRKIHTVPVRDDEGEVTAAMVISQDVTERRKREQRLREQREQLDILAEINALVQDLSEAVVEQSDVTDVQSAVQAHLENSPFYGASWIGEVSADRATIEPVEGIDTATLPVDPPLSVEPENASPTVWAARLGDTQVVSNLPDRDRGADAAWASPLADRGFESMAAIPLTFEGALYGVLTVYTDRSEISDPERRSLDRLGTIVAHAIQSVTREEQLRRSEERYRTLAENIPDGSVAMVGTDCTFQALAGGLVEEMEFDPSAFRGRRPTEVAVLDDESGRRLEDALEAALEGETRTFDLRNEVGAFEVQTLPVRSETDEIVGAMALARDVTDRVERAEELQYERERLEFLIRLVRHNLLNSLNLVDARLAMVEGNVEDGVVEHLDTAKNRTTEMIDLVDTIRGLTRVMVGDEPEDREAIPVDELLTDQIESATITFPDAEFETDALPSAEVMTDGLLEEAVENVLHNAVQHNDKPTPEVAVSATASDDAVTVSIADNGPGIPDHLVESVFDRGRGFEDPGTGFGLHIVREVVESYGGSVTVDDRDPEGAIVRLTLPRGT